MTSGFSSLNTALSALRHARVGMDVASENIANVATEGYARRRVESASAGAAATPAMWFRSTNHGDGVTVTGVGRMTDELLNSRVRREYANQGYLDVQQASLARVENGLGEPGPDGVAAALTTFRRSFDTLAHDPGGGAARTGVLDAAGTVLNAVRSQARNVESEMGDQRVRVLGGVAEAQTLVRDLARVNGAIVSGAVNGADVNALRDSRDRMAARLATLTGAQSTVQPDGSASVTLGGATLVEGSSAGSLTVASGVTPSGDPDGAPVRFAVTDPGGTTTVVSAGGELGGAAQLLDRTYPDHLAALAGVVRDVADAVNAQHRAGYDRAGDPGTDLFSYDPADVLGTVALAFTDPDRLAASSVAGPSNDGGNADALYDLSRLGDGYQRLVTGFGSAVVEIGRQVGNQTVLTNQVDAAAQQLGGVSLDEEMVTLTTLQRQYEAAARVMTTVDSLLDTLINRTGLVR